MRVRTDVYIAADEGWEQQLSLDAATLGFEYEVIEKSSPASGNTLVRLTGSMAGITKWLRDNEYDDFEFDPYPLIEIVIKVDGAEIETLPYDGDDELEESDVSHDVLNSIAAWNALKGDEFDEDYFMDGQITTVTCRKLESDERLHGVKRLPEHWRELDWHVMTQSPCLWGDDSLVAVNEDLSRGYRVFDGWCSEFDRELSDHKWSSAREFFHLDVQVACGYIDVETMGGVE